MTVVCTSSWANADDDEQDDSEEEEEDEEDWWLEDLVLPLKKWKKQESGETKFNVYEFGRHFVLIEEVQYTKATQTHIWVAHSGTY